MAGTRDVEVFTWLLLPVSVTPYASWKVMTFDIRQTKRSWLSSSILLRLGNLRAFIESNR